MNALLRARAGTTIRSGYWFPFPRTEAWFSNCLSACSAAVSKTRLNASDHLVRVITVHPGRRNSGSRNTGGTLLNAVGDEVVPFKDVAAAIGRSLNLPVKSVSAEEAAEHFGMPLAIFAQLDVPASSKRTREQFGWEPVEPGLIADIDARHYANAASTH